MRIPKRHFLILLSRIVLIVTILFWGFHFFFGFVYENFDSYNYWAFGEYLRTDIYPFVWPYVYDKPTTISPPLYSIVLMMLTQLPRGDILIHLMQVGMLILSGYFVYRILRTTISKPLSIIVSCLSLFIPGTIIYSSYVMTETGMQFFLIFYCFLFFVFLKTKRVLPLSLSVCLGCIMGLWKYSFIVYGFFSLVVFLWIQPKKIASYIFPFFGIVLIGCWVIYNHTITGVWGLSDTKSLMYQTMMVWEGNVSPSENHPAMKRFREYVPATVSVHDGYWTFLPYVLPKVNYQWKQADEIVGGIGKAAVSEHPVLYVKTVIQSFFQTHMHGSPYWSNLSRFGNDDPRYPLYCKSLGTMKFCTPVIITPWTYPLWNAFVRSSDWFYQWIFPIWSIGIFFPMLFVCLLGHNKLYRWSAILFFVGRIPIAMTAMTESRYLVPFYPLMVVITVFGITQITKFLRKKN